MYDMNTPKESYEWYDISIARNDEFRVSKERINIVEHAQKAQPSGAPSRKPGGNPGPSGAAPSQSQPLPTSTDHCQSPAIVLEVFLLCTGYLDQQEFNELCKDLCVGV